MEKRIHAYEIYGHMGMPLVPAPAGRDWMDASAQRFAYRCLPLVMANQSGWLIQNPTSFTASWNGGMGREDVIIEFDVTADPRILSNFGCGVLTFSLPYLFRTPRGINLWVKGPSNWIKDGAQALEGVVETDWSPMTFTVNWKLTRPGYPVRFERGEPMCMIVPVPRGLAESLEACREPLENNPELQKEFAIWDARRGQLRQSSRRYRNRRRRRGMNAREKLNVAYATPPRVGRLLIDDHLQVMEQGNAGLRVAS
jgi:hypothetical protein